MITDISAIFNKASFRHRIVRFRMFTSIKYCVICSRCYSAFYLAFHHPWQHQFGLHVNVAKTKIMTIGYSVNQLTVNN